MVHHRRRGTHGAMVVEYSLLVVVIGISLVATVGLSRVVLSLFSHVTTCYAVVTCPSDAPSAQVPSTAGPPAAPIQTTDALGNAITLGCETSNGSSSDNGCGAAHGDSSGIGGGAGSTSGSTGTGH